MNHRIKSRLVMCSLFTFLLNSPINIASTLPNDIEMSFVAELETASGLDNEDKQKLELQMQPEIIVDLTKDWQLTALGRFRANAQDNLNRDQQSTAELREFYLETTIHDTFLNIGKQQVVWGKADGLKVLDVINPQDFREFILDDFADSRIPLWGINAEIPFDDTVLQLLFIPDQTYHKFANRDTAYRFTSPLVSPTVPNGTKVIIQNLENPSNRVQDADFAMRLSSFWHGWDLTLNYLYHYSDTPVFFRTIDNASTIPLITIKPQYKRAHLLGSSFSNAFDSLTLRGEVAYSFNRYFPINDQFDQDGVMQSNELAYVLGFDWHGIKDTFLSFQLFQTYTIKDNPSLIRDQWDTTLTFLYRQAFYNDTLEIETLMVHNLNNDDGLIRPKIKYQWQDEINVWTGFDTFYGDANGLFGQFDGQDRFVVGIEWGI